MVDASDFKDNAPAIVKLINGVKETLEDVDLDNYYRDKFSRLLSNFPAEFLEGIEDW